MALRLKYYLIQQICESLNTDYIHICDDSHRHAGHQGVDRHLDTHFSLTVVSNHFKGKSQVQRHRLINDLTHSFYGQGLHALQLTTKTPGEWYGQ